MCTVLDPKCQYWSSPEHEPQETHSPTDLQNSMDKKHLCQKVLLMVRKEIMCNILLISLILCSLNYASYHLAMQYGYGIDCMGGHREARRVKRAKRTVMIDPSSVIKVPNCKGVVDPSVIGAHLLGWCAEPDSPHPRCFKEASSHLWHQKECC